MVADIVEHRRNTRVKYGKSTTAPSLLLLHGNYRVIDISETGIRFAFQRTCTFHTGQQLFAYLVFPGGLSMAVEGVVTRVDGFGVAIRLQQPLPADIIHGISGEKRAFFRLRYPPSPRPHLAVSWHQWEISEISAYGLRCKAGNGVLLSPGMTVRAAITFSDRTNLEITGTVLRTEGSETVITLQKGIPEARVMQEQRHVIQRLRPEE